MYIYLVRSVREKIKVLLYDSLDLVMIPKHKSRCCVHGKDAFRLLSLGNSFKQVDESLDQNSKKSTEIGINGNFYKQVQIRPNAKNLLQ